MDIVISVLETALPVFVMLIMGMLFRSKNFISREGVDTLKKVVVNLTLPFALFSAFATAEYTVSSVVIPAVIYVTLCICLLRGRYAGSSAVCPAVPR